ncbi:hypothetical protein ABKV19_026962, partial [Rosa sericea]
STSRTQENYATDTPSAEHGRSADLNPDHYIIPWVGLPSYDREPHSEIMKHACKLLYKAAVNGNWIEAKKIIEKDETNSILGMDITHGKYTALHVAAGAAHVHFVNQLLEMMATQPDYLKYLLRVKDGKGNTAFCLAAAAGSVEIIETMMEHDPSLLQRRGGEGKTPLYMATLFGHERIASYLYVEPVPRGEDLLGVFFSCINTGLYGLAAEVLTLHPGFALKRDAEHSKTALHLLAEKPSIMRLEQRGSPAHSLVKDLWRSVTRSKEFAKLVKTPTHLLFDALKSGNSEFVTMLVRENHPLLWEKDRENRTIIHAAVSLRQANVCKLIHEVGLIKNLIIPLKDDRKNTLLHLAARLAPKSQLNKWSGAALRMQHELKWFEDVKRIMPPSYIDMKNSDDQTAQEVFTSEHAGLLKEAEKWMNDAARSSMVVSSLLVSALFTTGITVALGPKTSTAASDQKTNSTTADHHLKRISYKIFIMSDAVALFMGLIATLMFFYILTSRYAEKDFLEDLPSKLLTGLIFLFISIIAMMATFSTVIFIAYGVKNVLPYLVLLLAVVALLVLLKLLLPFGQEIRASTTPTSLFEPSHN